MGIVQFSWSMLSAAPVFSAHANRSRLSAVATWTASSEAYFSHLMKSILNLKHKTGLQLLVILCISDRQKCRQLKNQSGLVSFFCKSRFSKMVSVKTNKNKNGTPLLKINFSLLETLFLGPKRFLHSKGPKNTKYVGG